MITHGSGSILLRRLIFLYIVRSVANETDEETTTKARVTESEQSGMQSPFILGTMIVVIFCCGCVIFYCGSRLWIELMELKKLGRPTPKQELGANVVGVQESVKETEIETRRTFERLVTP
eukprot:gnl/TRDRNA2_/TRDRNA2_146665_c0_seq1.p1 gnl/TRDRNA2_/TRDRNA2_146665_c0~~gnl/TRDRNA2_/TRDRNA2_146665_c0_seq1.p1  ORF type:complete len:120 (-),score=9.96 gnl/TRDRNA2_/TRDRNA2_146665_c0_seq1:152-511(-)